MRSHAVAKWVIGACSLLVALGAAQAQGPTRKPPGESETEAHIRAAVTQACFNAHASLSLPGNIVATVAPSTTLGMVNLKWTSPPGLDVSVTYVVQTLILRSGSWSVWGGGNLLPYNASSFNASELPLLHQLKFGISAVKTVTADIPSSTGQVHPAKVKCPAGPVFSNIVEIPRPAYQVGVLPPKPIPSIPAGDDIILYIHGGPGSRLEEASDLVAPLQREGLAVGKRYTVISFDQVSQGYSSMIDPDSIVPRHKDNVDYYPLVAFSENSIVAFLRALDPIVSLGNRNIYAIGGSTGGALALRLGRSEEVQKMPWVKRIVAWNPASVWTTYTHDALKGVVLKQGFNKATDYKETVDSRKGYLEGVFGSPLPFDVPGVKIQPNPEEWYRGDRGPSPAWNHNPYPSDTQKPFRTEWDCKWDYIGQSRLEHREIYNEKNRRWYFRLGMEELLFSFFNDSWLGPANTAPDKGGKPANYLDIVKPTLLVASDDDDWNEGYVSPDDLIAVSALLTLAGGGSFGVGQPIYFHWENRWIRVRLMAPLMKNTPGHALYVPDTGHSIHNERPNFFANQIVGFLSGAAPMAGPLQIPHNQDEFDESKMPAESCTPQLSQFLLPNPALLDAPTPQEAQDAVTNLKNVAQLGGNFSNGKGPGEYSLRLRSDLRAFAQGVPQAVAQGKDPTGALLNTLAHAAVSFYKGDATFGNAFADLAVTGRSAYAAFRNHQPSDNEIIAAARNVQAPVPGLRVPVLLPPIDEAKLRQAAQAARTRAYQVAWALRGPDPLVAYWLRQTLGGIAVSGEDDSPDRPVNVPSGIPVFASDGNTQVSAYPQYDLQITMCRASGLTDVPVEAPLGICPPLAGAPVPIQIRYTIASPPVATPARIGNAARQPGQGARSSAGSVMQTAMLSAAVCLTSDGKNCLPPKAPSPAMGQARQAIVTISSGGQPVGGAEVSVSGQNVGVLTNASGVAVVNYKGCSYSSRNPVGIPVATPAACQGSVTMPGYQSVAIRLP